MFHNKFMQEAYKLACKAYSLGEVPVGSIVIWEGEIIGAAHNQVETLKNPLAHAEILAIEQALNHMQNKSINNCELFVTLEPCPMCAHAISLSRIKKIYFGAINEKSGGIYHGAKVYNSSSCNHIPEVISGIMEIECSELLKNFFASLRKEL